MGISLVYLTFGFSEAADIFESQADQFRGRGEAHSHSRKLAELLNMPSAVANLDHPSPMLQHGREAFDRRRWAAAYADLLGADQEQPLAGADLEKLGRAANLIGKDVESTGFLARAYQYSVNLGDRQSAARCAFWLAFSLLQRGEIAQGGGWLSRAQSALKDHGQECAEEGYLLIPLALQQLESGNAPGALAIFEQAASIGQRFRDWDLRTLGMLGRGTSLIRQGKLSEGLALLDEAMVAVTAEEVSPLVVGIVYCVSIETCDSIFDLRRTHEWTAALRRWCEAQPDLVPFRGECLVHRAEVMQRHGDWQDAALEAQRACDLLSNPPIPRAVGAAFYQRAELHRLRGEFNNAEDAFRQASRWVASRSPA